MLLTVDVWEAVGALGSIVAAAVAAWAALQSRVSATEANEAAKAMTAIERDRRHAEMTPHFKVQYRPSRTGSGRADLAVTLLGPVGLDHLDSLTLVIRDDYYRNRERELRAAPMPEEIESEVWGPLKIWTLAPFSGIRVEEVGRTATRRRVPVGDELSFSLERTSPPAGLEDVWLLLNGTVFRSALAAHHEVYGSWRLPWEFDVDNLADSVTTFYLPDDQHTRNRDTM
jgi:hypothetical protein